ncbi:hypothetical protein EIP86_003835 [Pleurotus ostreatoroseus]|nr:hypothetical protein EIP86_003835 [Pleurotus ostreatoroseus]
MLRLRRYLTRHAGYLPLPGQGPSNQPSYPTVAFCVVSIALLASLIANIVLTVKVNHHPPRPLDDYQNLNTAPFWADDTTGPLNPEENAIVTTLYTDSYATAVATLGHSLQKVNATAQKIVLYLPHKISPSALCLATSSGFQPRPVERISPPHGGKKISQQFIDQFTKLSLWTLDTIGIRRLVYLDADTLVMHNFDEIFGMPYRFAAVSDVWEDWRGYTLEFNAGVLFLRPDSAVFQHMMSELPTARFPLQYAEQAYLNQYFAADAVRLPLMYNGNLAAKHRFPQLWEGMRNTIRVIHYTMVKPFVGAAPQFTPVPIDKLSERVKEAAEEFDGAYREEVELWGNVWEETRMAYARELEHCLSLSTQPSGKRSIS